MATLLLKPVTEKHSNCGSDDRLLFSSSAMQGWREDMEDAHTAELMLKYKEGSKAANFCNAHLHERIASDPAFPNNIEEAKKSGFLGIDEDLRNGIKFN
ncbi:hypothetical protein RclHR1_17090001 [Rhizophagus clarus]|uniref:Uncharacterized protein n=1 Tax=Rhizophagus clarus TaxID=94130 RepID=A0A2Z6QJC6_9GLOM|nr:hypothetical protein RclHR1_17090001 [Rhizophagus clarus]